MKSLFFGQELCLFNYVNQNLQQQKWWVDYNPILNLSLPKQNHQFVLIIFANNIKFIPLPISNKKTFLITPLSQFLFSQNPKSRPIFVTRTFCPHFTHSQIAQKRLRNTTAEIATGRDRDLRPIPEQTIRSTRKLDQTLIVQKSREIPSPQFVIRRNPRRITNTKNHKNRNNKLSSTSPINSRKQNPISLRS